MNSFARRPLAPLGRITCIALFVNALAYGVYFYLVFLIVGVIVPVLVITLLTLTVMGLVMSGHRWTLFAGAFVASVTSIVSLAQPEFIYNLTHPGDVRFFAVSLVVLASGVITIVAGFGSVFQYQQKGVQQTPGYFSAAFVGIVCFLLGAISVSVVVAAIPSASSTSGTSTSNPVVHMNTGNFVQNIVLVPKGAKLLLIDDGQFEHILQNGEWNADGSIRSFRELGAPVVDHLSIMKNDIEIGPFTTAGIYHIYCTIHHGMNLTVLVQ